MVITFYSYKGGVGRTQLLANAAVALANRGRDVVMVDMDLESPGLHTYFTESDAGGVERPLSDLDLASRPGLIDILTEQWQDGSIPPDIRGLLMPVDHSARERHCGSLRLLPAGRLDEGYPQRVASFPWEAFYAERQGYAFMEYVREALVDEDDRAPRPDFVLIDSRTGLTDIGSICTAQLPDVLVVLFALHAQGIDGAKRIAHAVDAYRSKAGQDARLQQVFLLPSRVEESSHDKRDRMLEYATRQLTGFGELLIDLFDRLPYEREIAYGEPIVVGSTPTYLSLAYERFVDRLEKLAKADGTQNQALARPAAEQVTAPWQLFSAIDRLDDEIRQLSVLQGKIADGIIADFLAQAHGFADVLRGARAAYNDACEMFARLAEDGGSVAFPPFLERLSDRDGFLNEVSGRAELCVNAWVERWIKQATERLTAASVADPETIAGHLAALTTAARSETFEEIEARLGSIESLLRRNSLDQQLRERRLGSDLLERVIPEPAGRRQWLEDRLARLQEDGDLGDQSLQNQLWNALGLLLPLLGDRPDGYPEPIHWNAYDLLCMLTSAEQRAERREEELHCFVEIGFELWARDWHALLCSDGTRTPEWPCGLDARSQLRRVAEVGVDKFNALVDLVADDFRAGQLSHAALLRLLEQRGDDPVVAGAMDRLAGDPAPGASRDLLAKWLYVRAAEPPADLMGSFLRGLADEGYVAEAFIAACAFRQRNPDAATEDWLADLAARYIALLASNGLISDIEALIVQPDFLGALCQSRPGLAVAALLAGFERDAPIGEDARRAVVTDLLHNRRPRDLPESVYDWLQRVERGEAHQEALATSLARLSEHVEGLMNVSVYGAWDGSPHFAQAFRDEWEPRYEALLDEPGKPGQLALVSAAPEAEGWIRATGKTLRTNGKHLKQPDGAAATNLIAGFQNMTEAMEELAAAAPSGASIRSVLEHERQRQEAFRELAAWFASDAARGANGACRHVSEAFGLGEP
jgi:MinD-like ATPase involved in chromosome partitioning or flagellar assembly